MSHAPVFVPTRGRAGRVKQEVLSLAPTLVVEAWDAPSYRRAYPWRDMLVMSQRDRGIAYARNVALGAARRAGMRYCWVLDDDLTDFARRERSVESARRFTRKPIEPGEALEWAEYLLSQGPDVAIAGIPAAWLSKSEQSVSYNANVACCVRFDLAKLGGLHYREVLRLGEDTDMALQCITGRQGSARVDDLDYQTPFWGTNTGGLQDEYEDRDHKAAQVQKLVAFWPGIVRAKPGATRYDIDWDRLASGEVSPAPVSADPPNGNGFWVGSTLTGGR